jgi:UDP-N-acetylglucosamine 2-epimerase
MKRIVTVLGARPQFIKASVVFRAIERSPDLQVIVVYPDVHFDANMGAYCFSARRVWRTVLGGEASTLKEEVKD